MGNSKGKAAGKAPAPVLRKVDRYFEEFSGISRHPGNRALQYLFIPLFWFALLGLIWMIPFPEIAFLKERGYHIFLNWASFFIAILVYYYLRLAPTLSYAILLSIGMMSFLIVQLEYLEQRGGPAVWMICAVLLMVSFLILWLGSRSETRRPSWSQFLKLLFHGPVWLWHFVFRKLKMPY